MLSSFGIIRQIPAWFSHGFRRIPTRLSPDVRVLPDPFGFPSDLCSTFARPSLDFYSSLGSAMPSDYLQEPSGNVLSRTHASLPARASEKGSARPSPDFRPAFILIPAGLRTRRCLAACRRPGRNDEHGAARRRGRPRARPTTGAGGGASSARTHRRPILARPGAARRGAHARVRASDRGQPALARPVRCLRQA
jgi:hypothetical protein